MVEQLLLRTNYARGGILGFPRYPMDLSLNFWRFPRPGPDKSLQKSDTLVPIWGQEFFYFGAMLIPSSIAMGANAMKYFPKLAVFNAAMIVGTLASALAGDRLLRLAAASILP